MSHICPHCGKNICVATPTNANLSDRIADRLAQYGFREATPQRYTKVIAVRNTIKLLLPGLPNGNGSMTPDVYTQAMILLNRILPDKTTDSSKSCNTCQHDPICLSEAPCVSCIAYSLWEPTT